MSNPNWHDVCLTAVEYAAAWLDCNEVDLPLYIIAGIAAVKFNVGQDLPEIQDEYNTRLYSVMDDYTATERPITAFRNAFKRVVYEGFFEAGQAGWIDAGATGLIPDSLTEYINGRFERETEYIDDLWQQLRELRKTGDMDEIANQIKARADGYTATLEGVYNYAMMLGGKERPGKWVYGDTDHCETCNDLNGQIHPLSWYIGNNFIPRQAGSQTLACRGFRCQCQVIDPETGEQLV